MSEAGSPPLSESPAQPAKEQPKGPLRLPSWVFFLLMLVILLAHTLLKMPQEYSVQVFGFGDPGTCLTLYEQVEQGRLPYRDHKYCYGLIPIPLGQLWFLMLGRTPATYLVWVGVCNVLLVWAILRYVSALRIGLVGQVWLLVTLPLAVPTNYLTLTHGMEAVLIAHALVEQVRGRRSIALAVATFCLFVKPSMAYFLGFMLLVFMVRGALVRKQKGEAPRSRFVCFLRNIIPAAVVGVGMFVGLALWIGPGNVFQSLLPLTGIEINVGTGELPTVMLRNLFAPEVKNLVNYYLGTSTGVLGLGTIALTLAALANLPRLVGKPRGEGGAPRAESLLTCAVVTLAYFGLMLNPVPTLYAYALTLGIAALASNQLWTRGVVAGLTVLALVGYYIPVKDIKQAWRDSERYSRLESLWCQRNVAVDWFEAVERTRGQRPALLIRCSGYGRLFEGFVRPTFYYFDPGLVSKEDVQREAEALNAARFVVLGKSEPDYPLLKWFPELAEPLRTMPIVRDGPSFVVYDREGPPSAVKQDPPR
jgi:hypothetical protein